MYVRRPYSPRGDIGNKSVMYVRRIKIKRKSIDNEKSNVSVISVERAAGWLHAKLQNCVGGSSWKGLMSH